MPHNQKTIKVGVLAGGIGSERQVSLQSGRTIFDALRQAGIDAVLSDITPDDIRILDDASIDVYFLALHGRFGEDGSVQTLLQQRRRAFTGSDAEASRKAFDKIVSKAAFAQVGAVVPRQIVVSPEDTEATLRGKLDGFAHRVVIKPTREGSSVGVDIVADPAIAAQKAMQCFQTYGDCMIEEFIAGRELTVGIVNGRALPIIEIRSKAAFYDYNAKYIADSTEYLFDTITDVEMVERIQKTALDCFAVLGCRHLSRLDLILSDRNVPYVLELNTLPGFTSHSLLPMAARHAGISTPQLCRDIVEAAWRDHHAAQTSASFEGAQTQ
jgi:D-alanine-D-alanine ligase